MSDTSLVRSAFFAAVLALAFGAVSCDSARRGEPIAGRMNLYEASLQRGQAVFDAHCYKCHTKGEGGMSPAINDKPLPKFLMRFQVRYGLGAMPGFSRDEIGDRELDDLLDYLIALRRHNPKPDPSNLFAEP
jgi:mono/diheme cytochrome c family protein